jgi:hypothetical protein
MAFQGSAFDALHSRLSYGALLTAVAIGVGRWGRSCLKAHKKIPAATGGRESMFLVFCSGLFGFAIRSGS